MSNEMKMLIGCVVPQPWLSRLLAKKGQSVPTTSMNYQRRHAIMWRYALVDEKKAELRVNH